MAEQQERVGGIDSHKDTIHVAVISDVGQPVGDQEFPTTTGGYRKAVGWLIEHGPLSAVGVEGTSSYGVGITTALTQAGIKVVEVNRTRPADGANEARPTNWMPTAQHARYSPVKLTLIPSEPASSRSGH
ncbi:MAG: transposase [Nakamurella sp.]